VSLPNPFSASGRVRGLKGATHLPPYARLTSWYRWLDYSSTPALHRLLSNDLSRKYFSCYSRSQVFNDGDDKLLKQRQTRYNWRKSKVRFLLPHGATCNIRPPGCCGIDSYVVRGQAR
ncbi:unnamed protein product, partial [Sphacelaria rigidula]